MPSLIEPTPAAIIAAIEAEGLSWVAVGDWAGRCRCHEGRHVDGGPTIRKWSPPPAGLTVHITTGTRSTGQNAIDYTKAILIAGNGTTPGPLSQFGLDGDGRVILVALGRSNHVGSIGSTAARMIRDGSFSFSDDYDNRGQGSGVDGNAFTYGVEIYSPPTPSPVQRAAAVKLAAALCKLMGWSPGSVHGHGEVASSRSWTDPGLDMGKFRTDVYDRIRWGALDDAAAPATNPEELTVAQIDDILSKLGKLEDIATESQARLGAWAGTLPLGPRIDRNHAELSGRVAGLTAAVQQLSGGQGIDVAAIEDAVRRAVADSIASIDVTVTGA